MATGAVTGREYKRTRVRGFAAWNPRPNTLVLVETVQEIIEEYDQALTLRQVFYRLVGAHGYPKTEQAYDRLGEYLNRARRAEMIDWDAIRDDSNVVPAEPGWDSTSQFWATVESMAEDYLRTPRGDSYVEVWVEAAGMVPQIETVADPFGVRVVGSGGFSSVTARRVAAERLTAVDSPVHVLLIGDLDPSGASIMDSTAEDVLAFVDDTYIEFARLGVTDEQAEGFALVSAPQKPDDRRGAYMAETYQAEALDPADLAGIVRDALLELIPQDVLDDAEATGDGERERLLAAIAELTR